MATMQILSMQIESTLALDDLLPSLLLEEERACRYQPGEFLRRSIRDVFEFGMPENDKASDFSTTDSIRSERSVPPSTEFGCLEVETSIEDQNNSLSHHSNLPSVGSESHWLGSCSPCGFLHKGTCSQGSACKFCHLCPPGSIELKRKMKRKLVRGVKRG